MNRSIAALAPVLVAAMLIAGCSSKTTSAADETTTTAVPATSSTTTTMNATAGTSAVLVAFPDQAAADAWINVDDSVMGGVSASESTWTTEGGSGAMAFTGLLSTERNGGFASTFAPIDRSLGLRAAGARALAVDATGDGRTYLLQLRVGGNGNERWIARFTPAGPTSGQRVSTIAIDTFEPVSQFLRPTVADAPLDPASIFQIGIYVLDGQVGRFRLVLNTVTAIK